MEERLQKLLSQAGVCSRRAAEELLSAGRVRVDGAVAVLGQKADPEIHMITVDGKQINFTEKRVYLMLHKPRGTVTTLSDEQGRPTAAELVRDCGARVFPVGRLDMDSEGLLLFTNDGEWMQHLLHPKYEVRKTYEALVSGDAEAALTPLREMRTLEWEPIAPAEVTLLEQSEKTARLQIVIHEGKNRQVRRMCAAAGLRVLRLCRVAEETLRLGDLPVGRWRYLTEAELTALGAARGAKEKG